MSDVKTSDPPVSANTATGTLVQGIVGDIGELIKHEVRFARAEFLSDLAKMKTAALLLVAGGTALTVGLVLLSLMLVHLLNALTIPTPTSADQLKGLPLWACYGIVGAVFAVVGGVLGYIGSDRLSRLNPLPEKTAQTVQENVSWIANQTANSK